jgi:hypothetical protein
VAVFHLLVLLNLALVSHFLPVWLRLLLLLLPHHAPVASSASP